MSQPFIVQFLWSCTCGKRGKPKGRKSQAVIGWFVHQAWHRRKRGKAPMRFEWRDITA